MDDIIQLNQLQLKSFSDPEISTRILQYELAFLMQTSFPAITETSNKPEYTWRSYGDKAKQRETYASHCLLARRLIENDVGFVQLFHRGWDQHLHLPKDLARQCRDTDRGTVTLVRDLAERGLLDNTLVVWGGEFGRTMYCQGDLSKKKCWRDHHPRCFTIWMAGGGVTPGMTYAETDDFS